MDDFSEWDRLVEESSQGTIFNTTDWLKICAETWRGKLKIWGCFRNDELVGGCALRVLNFGFLRRAANSSMMTPYYGVIKKSTPSRHLRNKESFHRRIINSLSKSLEKLSFVRLVNSPAFVDVRPFTLRGWTTNVKYTYFLPLEDVELNNFEKKTRYDIRKAEKYNFSVERSDDIGTYFKLYKSMLLRKGEPPPSPKLETFFKRIVRLLNQKKVGELWVAKTSSDEIAAGEIVVFDNKRAYRWGAASHDKYLHTGVTSYLLYKVILRLKGQFSEFDMGGADFPNLAHHTAGFNPEIVPCYVVEKSSAYARTWYAIIKKAHNYMSRFI